MTDRGWEFDASPASAPPVRPRPVPMGSVASFPLSAVPPAAPAPPDPFGSLSQQPSPYSRSDGSFGAYPAAPASIPATPASPRSAGASGGIEGGDRSGVASSPTGSRWGWRTFLAFVAGGALTAAGFGVGYGTDRTQTIAAPAASTVPASNPGDAVVVTPPDLDTTEPAAFVAALLGPSVVQIETNRGLGSGVIFDDGLILTNNHVIEAATTMRVRLSDGRTLSAEILGADPRTDIAVVSVGTGLDLPAAALALGDPLEVGQYTVAIGSPFELQQTVTSGIISAVNRPVYNGTGWNAMVQTDAAINPGNSGGALADRQGQVIGINTAIQTDGVSSTNAGIGFAMPIDTAYDVAQRLLAGESLEPGFLGIAGGESGSDELGVTVVEVTVGSAAADAGVLVGDRVLTLDGAPVSNFAQLAGLIQTSFPGDQVMLEVIRDGEVLEVMVTLGER